MRRITLFVVVAATVVTMALPAFAAPGEHKGRDPTGKPYDPDCWGEVTEQFASNTDDEFTFGQHASDPIPGDDDRETPREGVANVSKTDSNPAGDTPSDHGAAVGPFFGAFCEPGPETG